MYIFDCEGNSLYPSKFHCLSYSLVNSDKIVSLTTHDEMRDWLLGQPFLIGHNIIRWDIPHLERVLNIKIEAQLIDTLALSWYLYDKRNEHGLEVWGREFGIEKPPIKDWENLSVEEYIYRCEEDVKINSKLWTKVSDYLKVLYNDPDDPAGLSDNDVLHLPIVRYLSFKLDCAREQERSRWRLDKDKCLENISILEKISEDQGSVLASLMPDVPNYKTIKPPKKPFKKDGTLSSVGVRWRKYLSDQSLTFPYHLPIKVLHHYDPPNPKSSDQIKDFLFSLGWEPETFKYVKEDDGTERKIPQVKELFGSELCPSVKRLIEDHPKLKALEGYSIANHRLGVLKGFIRDVDEEGFLQAKISGLTNTLRFIHKEIVNVPGKDKLYGQYVRECLIAREDYELVGSDMTALEDLTKRHYMYPHDPAFVEEMSHPNYDPHLSLAAYAGAIPSYDIEDLATIKLYKKEYDKERQDYKKTNYSATYGIGGPKLARDLRSSFEKAKKLLGDFWDKNWAIRVVAEEQIVKTIKGQMWLYNPVSGFWYSLRYDKDRFSTLNQGTGVYCFDRWIHHFRKERKQLTAQFHDEVVLEIRKGYREEAKELLLNAIDKVNEELKLNVTLSIDIKFGDNYAGIH